MISDPVNDVLYTVKSLYTIDVSVAYFGIEWGWFSPRVLQIVGQSYDLTLSVKQARHVWVYKSHWHGSVCGQYGHNKRKHEKTLYRILWDKLHNKKM